MRVTLATYGSRGDVEPFVALALELKKLGADVTLCIPPDEEFVGLADRFEIATRTFPRAWHSWAEEQTTTAEEHVVSVDDYVRKYIDATFEPLRRAVDGADILIASGMLHFVSGSVAELTGVPYHFVIFAPNLLGSQAWQGAARAPLDAHRAANGLRLVGDVRRFLFSERPWLAADRVLAPESGTADLHTVRTDAWVLNDERVLPAELEAFLKAGPPPVYVGFGSMRVGTEIVRTATDAIRANGCRAVISKGQSGLQLIDELRDCFLVGEVNHQALFRRVAAVIHHGGAGTTYAAARARTPQVVVPQSASDQYFWADRVSALGIGIKIDGAAPSTTSLSHAIAIVLSDSMRNLARDVSARMRADGAAQAARTILAETY
ncbi:glycosyltransferase [Pseudorhizobium pelagicum]|uniref:Glycosyl transferase n=1 Tax=Pseudorhizobium pelagicum TaxID=1509405 RepID=A0A922T9P2_9HYPH|nr:glycosyltransferase [Pseudorhizobium pelagicum]KEQ03225.1 glycosyl transferase [Pseudorhizobium pelagicum]KEQ04908.1 glycosyl transferase [Pseudorhizobium pelagicum]